MEAFAKFAAAMTGFEKYFDTHFAEYCTIESTQLPCEFFHYPSDVSAQEILGHLDALVGHIIINCKEGFGHLWLKELRFVIDFAPSILILFSASCVIWSAAKFHLWLSPISQLLLSATVTSATSAASILTAVTSMIGGCAARPNRVSAFVPITGSTITEILQVIFFLIFRLLHLGLKTVVRNSLETTY